MFFFRFLLSFRWHMASARSKTNHYLFDRRFFFNKLISFDVFEHSNRTEDGQRTKMEETANKIH